jgi:hypothetical protein
MKRILAIAFALAMVLQGALSFAQESGEPSEGSVLEAARNKYWGSQDSSKDNAQASRDSGNTAPDAAEDGDAPQSDDCAAPPSSAIDRGEYARYSPFIISFVPGLSFPFDYRDTSLALGAVGILARDVEGLAAGGVFAMARDVHGLQGAGVFGIAHDIFGLQGAGVFTIAHDMSHGVQGSGVFNIANEVRGVQGAGAFNIAGDLRGVQGAGVFNIAGDLYGGQAAGVFNVARDVHGIQIGVVNVAREVEGMQIGLVNISSNGIDTLGLLYEPASDYLYGYWQAGSPFLFAIFGYGSTITDTGWSFNQGSVASVGLGTRARFLGLKIDADLSAEQPIGSLPYGSFDYRVSWASWEGWSLLAPYPTLKISVGLPLGRHFQLVAGLKADVDIACFGSRVPEALKVGKSWSGRLFDEDFTVYQKWFFGVKF